MKLTTKGRYAVLAMLDLAFYDQGDPISLPEISERQNISLSYLEQLFSRLKRRGLVLSSKGPGGGYKLAKNSNKIYVSDIIDAVDESLETTACQGKANCTKNQKCLSHNLWESLGFEIRNFLSDISLQQVIMKNTTKEEPLRKII
tara:strand:+ start:178 stop:612 length:435 start_codon:yes stop_codon:yes gene_type:complete